MKQSLLKFTLLVLMAFMLVSPYKSSLAQTDNSCLSGYTYDTTVNECVPISSSSTGSDGGVQGVLSKLSSILNSVIPVLVGLGVVYLVWGVVQYVIGDGEEAKKAGKDRVIFGIIGLAVIISLWGLVNIVANTFGLNSKNNTAPTNASLNNLLPH